MTRREFAQTAAAVAAGHSLGLSSLLPAAPVTLAAWYAARCAFCGYEFPDADLNRWNMKVPDGDLLPYILCSVCIWHGPRADSMERLARPR